MLLLINILVIFCTITLASAGPIRRYTNTTTETNSSGISGVHYDPPTNSPSTSPLLVDGVTRLPSTLLAERQSDSAFLVLPSSSLSSPATTKSRQIFQYQPLESDSTASTATDHVPTTFKTFGDQPAATTLTVWSTTWITVAGSTQNPDSGYAHISSQTTALGSQPQNATSNLEQTADSTSQFSFDPVPTSSSNTTYQAPSPSIFSSKQFEPLDSAAQHQSSPNSAATKPHASSATTSSLNPTDLPRFSLDTSDGLPEVLTESPPATNMQSSQAMSISNATDAGIPGITIVPQNPSVIYITTTVTDAGVTTTMGN